MYMFSALENWQLTTEKSHTIRNQFTEANPRRTVREEKMQPERKPNLSRLSD